MWLVVCALFTLERGVCVSSYLRDMEDTETIEFMLRLVSRVFLTAWAVHTRNEPGTMKFLRMEVEVLWFQLFCKTRTEKIRWSGCVNCESDPWMIEAFLKEAMLEHLVTHATPCALDWYCYRACQALRDDVIDYKQMIRSSTLLTKVNRVVSTTVEDSKEQYISCQV